MEVQTHKNSNPRIQTMIDAVAQNLELNHGIYVGESPAELAELLDLCPEQDVWMYEPDPADPEGGLVFATFRLQASYGTRFHMSCSLDVDGQIGEWIGPHDITIRRFQDTQVYTGVAA